MAGPHSYESPQTRRLRHDLKAMEALRDESSVLSFRSFGQPAQRYLIEFRGRSLARERGKVVIQDRHEVEVKLGVSYPRTMPELRWLTPIYHPNISEIGLVCLGGYGTHWVPSLHLDDLCGMLWDMARFHNYDIRSPYNREAALWAANQTAFVFPTDARPLRDKRVALGRIENEAKANEGEAPAKIQDEPEPKKSTKFDESGGVIVMDFEVNLRRPAPSSPPPRPRPADQDVVFLD